MKWRLDWVCDRPTRYQGEQGVTRDTYQPAEAHDLEITASNQPSNLALRTRQKLCRFCHRRERTDFGIELLLRGARLRSLVFHTP